MAPQTSIPTSATVLGLIGTIFWCIQLCPQIWKSYRTKNTEGVPATMMFMWSCSSMPFAVYAIVQNFNVPLWVQPQCFGLLCMVSWGQVQVYSNKWPVWKTVMTCATILSINAGCQVAFVLILRPRYNRGLEWPVLLFGILAFICLAIGYIPIPFELIKRRGRIVGLSLLFLLIDWSGAFFSLLSLAAQNTFDPLFGTLYALCASIEAGMLLSHCIWLWRTRKLRKRAKEASLSFDDYPEAVEWQAKGMRFMIRRMQTADEEDVSAEMREIPPETL